MDTIGVILLLLVAGVWAFFLLPAFFTGRRDAPVSTTQEFSRLTARLQSVQRPAPRRPDLTRARVLARRRRILLSLTVGAVATIGLALWLGSLPLLGVHLVVDAVLAWYVVMLVQIRQRRREQSKVVDLRALEDTEKRVRIVASK
jgi:uncharacterized membrane protein YoaK (UPF0700 family)